MQQRTLIKSTAASATLLLLLAACGEDRTETGSAESPSTVAPSSTVRTPAKIKLASAGGRSAATSAAAPEIAVGEGDAAADSKIAPMPWRVTYEAGAGLTDITGARTSWFFPSDGYVVSDEQRAALAAAFGVTGEWQDLPADWGGGRALGPTDGTGANITISTDPMASWWYNPGPDAFPRVEQSCTTSVDAATGEEQTTCPEPTPPANVPDQATAEAKARDLLASMGLDLSQFEFESSADQWGAWVTAWLLLDGQRAPLTMYVGFGGDGVITGAGGFLARPIQGDQYDLVGIDKGIERLNDQQYGWIGIGGGVARTGVAVAEDTAVAPADAVSDAGGTDGSAPTETMEPMPTDGQLVDPTCVTALRPDVVTETDDAGASEPVDCTPSVDVQPVTVTLTGVRTDLTMVWDAEGTVWLLPAYTFLDDQGGQYQVIAVSDEFIELPEALPVPEPMPVESGPAVDEPAPAVAVDQAGADSLVGLSEDEAAKVAAGNGWESRVVMRDGESLPATADYRTDRVNFTVEGGVVTAVSIG